MTDIDLAIVIVTYNSEKDIVRCLNSIHKFHDEYIGQIHVIVVDNASSDNTLGLVRETVNWCRYLSIIESKNNVGFGNACNLAFSKIDSASYLLLNPDAFFVCDSLSLSLPVLVADSRVAVCGFPLVFEDGVSQSSVYRYTSVVTWIPTILGVRRLLEIMLSYRIIAHVLKSWPPLYEFSNSQMKPRLNFSEVNNLEYTYLLRDVDWVCGACMYISRSFLNQYGGFDRRFFLYGEDEDLCIAAKRLGFRVCSIDAPPLAHDLGWNKNRINSVVAKYKYDSLALFINKNIKNSIHRLAMLYILPVYIYGFAGALSRFFRSGK